MSVKCPKCNAENPDTQSFCGDCGTNLDASKDIPEVTKTIKDLSSQLKPGDLLADRYKVIGILGKGGMGEVYQAEDTNLKRQVAIKVLPQQHSLDEERLARFEREAKVLASLNHPNIAAIYGLEESEGKRFLVLELVEGETLAERINKGALSIEDSLEACRQIAEAVEAAHEKGIIHRDLKPANVKITPEGRVKVLDFGLAKALFEEKAGPALIDSPTITAQMTQPGVILGTAAYMSPEQARGKPVDKRTDIWAFGCLLYEMLSGKRAFGGETSEDQTVSDLIASVLSREPEYEKLPEDTPLTVKRLLRRCLQKDLNKRLRDIGDAGIELSETLTPADDLESLQTRKKSSHKIAAAYILIGILIGAAIGIPFLIRRSSRPTLEGGRITKFPLQLSEQAPFLQSWTPGTGLAISPDGSQVVFTSGFDWGEKRLYSRSLDNLEIREIKGTKGAMNPFFSPDGKWIGFFDVLESSLKKMLSVGGQPFTLKENVMRGGSASAFWCKDGSIIFTAIGSSIQKIIEESGIVEILLDPKKNLDTEERLFFHTVQLLPDSRSLLYTEWDLARPNTSRVKIFDLKSRASKILLEDASYGRYINSGHLLFTRDRILFAVPFEVKGLKVGKPIKPLELSIKTGFLMTPWPQFQFVVSPGGTLVYAPSSAPVKKASTLVWIDQNGNSINRVVHPILYPYLSLSEDGTKIALVSLSGKDGQLDVDDPDRGGLRLIERGIVNCMPVWSPDGSQLVFRSSSPAPGLYSKKVESNNPPDLILKDPYVRTAFSWSKDGRYLAYTRENLEGQADIWILPMNPPGESWAFLEETEREDMPAFSPDGNWIAYTSDKRDGQLNVFIQRFPEGGTEIPISDVSGKASIWSENGREIYYTSVEGSAIYRVSFESQPEINVGTPELIFEGDILYSSQNGLNYAFSHSTKSLLVVERDEPRIATNLIVVLNWFEELKRIMSSEK